MTTATTKTPQAGALSKDRLENDLLDKKPRRADAPPAKTTDGLTDYDLDLLRDMKTPGAPL